ncbi:MAG TPA: YfhO family protein [Gemmatimonadaceae bacterium]
MARPDSPSASPLAMPAAPRLATMWAALTYAAATLLLGWPALLGRFLVTTHSDQYIAGYAFREFAAASLRAGQGFPQWNPYLQGGMPYIAAMHGDIFYPTFLLRMILPTDVAMTWGFVIHTFLCGLLTYGFLRAAGIGFWGALVGGLAYLMGGPVASLVSPGHDGKLFVSALLPAALWLLTLGIRRARPWAWGLLALVIGLAVLSPHPQLLQYMLLTSGAYALWLAFGAGTDGVRLERPVALRRLAFALGAVVLGALMGGVQYLPVREYVQWSPRAGGIDYQRAISYSFPPEELLNTWLPQFTGILDRYWGRNGIHFHSEYLGVVVLFLAGLAFGWRRAAQPVGKGDAGVARGHSFLWFWVGTAILSLLWMLGGFTPFYDVIYAIVPGTKFFRAPSTIIMVFGLAIATLAALGTERLLTRGVGKGYLIGWGVFGLLMAILASTGALTNFAAGIASGFPFQGRDQLAESNAASLVVGAWRSFLFLAVALGLAWAAGERRLAPRAVAIALVAAVGLDLWSVLRQYWQFVPSAAAVYGSDAAIAAMKQDKAPFRVIATQMTPDAAYHDPFLNGDALMSHDIRLVYGYHGNALARYEALSAQDQGPTALLASPALRALLNVRYLLTDLAPDAPITQDGMTILKVIPGMTHVAGPVRNAAGSMVHLYRFAEETPLAWVASGIVKAPDEAVLGTVRDPRFDARVQRQVALFDTASAVQGQAPTAALPAPSTAQVQVVSYAPGRISLRLNEPAKAGNALVVSENYFPGWTATANGKAATVARADYSLIGIELPAGATEVQLAFRDPAYGTGKGLTLAALLAALLLAGAGLVMDRRTRHG